MAAPGIKLSELEKYAVDANGDETSPKYLSSIQAQKFLVADGGKNYQTPLSALSANFKNDFAAFETSHLSGSWNYTSGSKILANDPKFPIDVANGNTLSALQEIFDRLSTIWRIRIPFKNKYEPNIQVKDLKSKWITRDKSSSKFRGNIMGIDLWDTAWEKFPQVGINLISKDGGYVFLTSENPGLRQNVYMNADVDLNEPSVPTDPNSKTWLELLGWDDDMDKLVLIRYEIKPSSPVGVTFHCCYNSVRADGNQPGRTDHDAQVSIEYAGISMTGHIKYFYGTSVHTPDESPHQDNAHWGEGDPDWPDATGGPWKTGRDKHLEIKNVSGSRGPHGINMDIYDYCVLVDVQRITITKP